MAQKGEEEIFLSLEDDGLPTPPAPVEPQPVAEPVEEDTSYLTAEVIDTSMIEEASGVYTVTWPLLGMDCPDCAAKAMGALRHMKQVTESNVSATSGEVRVNVDLEQGPLSEVSSVLRSLGHAPDVEHHELVGVRAKAVAHRNNVPVAQLERVLRRQPGVLDAEVSEDDRILVQLVASAQQELVAARNRALEHIIGTEPKFAEATSNRLRPDQWRLIGGGIALPVLVLVMCAELLGYHGLLIPILALPGVLIGGLQMFKEALASLKNLQMGFQVLTSLAVIGAGILGMWEEALIVTILVAFTAHLEGDALLKAREAMQGGLDRLPRTARKINNDNALCFTPDTAITTASMGFSLPMAGAPVLPMANQATPDTEMVPIDLVRPGDKIEIRSGELIPADGRIVEGKGALDKIGRAHV